MRVRVRWTRNAPKIIYRPSKLLGFVSFGRKIGVWILGAVMQYCTSTEPHLSNKQQTRSYTEPDNKHYSCYWEWHNTATWHSFSSSLIHFVNIHSTQCCETHSQLNTTHSRNPRQNALRAMCPLLLLISHLGTFYQLCSFRRKNNICVWDTYSKRTVQLRVLNMRTHRNTKHILKFKELSYWNANL